MATKQINLRLDESLLTEIDHQRGLVPRNVWIVAALESFLSGKQVPLLKAERSPEPTSEIQPGKRANGHRDTCGCLNCERLLGKIQ